eukprot:CFRG4893T1
MAPQATPAAEFACQVDLLKMGNGVEAEFSLIEEEAEQQAAEYTTEAGKDEKNSSKNLDMQHLPYDHTLVKLSGDESYINANFISEVSEDGRAYIATQAPLENTYIDFWRMIWEQEVHVVVMISADNETVFKYWGEKGENMSVGALNLLVTEVFDYSMFVLHVIALSNYESGESRWIYHIQYKDFLSDGSVSNRKNFNDLLSVIDHYETQSPGKNVVVHCIHGQGRTGTVIAADVMKNKLEANKDMTIDLKELVLKLRQSRANMVGTPEQYAFLYEFVASITKELHPMQDTEPEKPPPQPAAVPAFYRAPITPDYPAVEIPKDVKVSKPGPARPPPPSGMLGVPESTSRSGSVTSKDGDAKKASIGENVTFAEDADAPLSPPILVKKKSFLQRMAHKTKKFVKYGNIPMIRPQKGDHKLTAEMKHTDKEFHIPTLVTDWVDKLNSDEKVPTLDLAPPGTERKVVPSLSKHIGLISYHGLQADNWFERPKGPRPMPDSWFQGLPPVQSHSF